MSQGSLDFGPPLLAHVAGRGGAVVGGGASVTQQLRPRRMKPVSTTSSLRTPRRSFIVVGAGIGGLAASIALRRGRVARRSGRRAARGRSRAQRGRRRRRRRPPLGRACGVPPRQRARHDAEPRTGRVPGARGRARAGARVRCRIRSRARARALRAGTFSARRAHRSPLASPGLDRPARQPAALRHSQRVHGADARKPDAPRVRVGRRVRGVRAR